MIEQIVRSKEAKIILDKEAFAQWHIPTNIGENEPEAGPQGAVTVISDHDAQDAEQELTDEIWRKPLWWILEFLPLSYMYQVLTPGPTPGTEGIWKWETIWW